MSISYNGNPCTTNAFPKGVGLKVSVIERLEFELAYYDIARIPRPIFVYEFIYKDAFGYK